MMQISNQTSKFLIHVTIVNLEAFGRVLFREASHIALVLFREKVKSLCRQIMLKSRLFKVANM